MKSCNSTESALESAASQAQILAEYLAHVDENTIDMRFVETHLRVLYQFAMSASAEAHRLPVWLGGPPTEYAAA